VITVLNSLTLQDYIELKSTLFASYIPRFNCEHCLNHKYHGNPKKLEIERRMLGCKDRVPTPLTQENLTYHRCPGNFASNQSYAWLEYHEKFKLGVMPFSGGYYEQPAKVFEIMRIVDSFKLQRDVEKAKQAELKQKVGVKRGRK